MRFTFVPVQEVSVPIDYTEYPSDWKERRKRILQRAGNRCEWCGAENHKPHPDTGSVVVLTFAHLNHDHDNADVEDDRLVALCQRCHLRYDRPRHMERARLQRDGTAGQVQLFDDSLEMVTQAHYWEEV